MREKDDGQYDLERGFLRATSWHVSPLQICYHNTCTIYMYQQQHHLPGNPWHASSYAQHLYRRSILPLLNNFKALMTRQRHQSLFVEIICITQDDAKTRQRNDGPCPFLLYLPPFLPSVLPFPFFLHSCFLIFLMLLLFLLLLLFSLAILCSLWVWSWVFFETMTSPNDTFPNASLQPMRFLAQLGIPCV